MSTYLLRTIPLTVFIFSVLAGCTTTHSPFYEASLEGHEAYQRGEYDKAIEPFNKSLEIAEQRKREAGSPQEKAHADAMIAQSLKNLGAAYSKQGRYVEAEYYYSRALTLRETVFRPDSEEVADVLNDLGFVYRKQGRPEEALPLFERAVPIYEKVRQPAMVAMALGNIGHVYSAQGRHAEAASTHARALALESEAIGRNPTPKHPGFPVLILRVKDYAAAVRKVGRTDEADQLDKRLADLLQQVDTYTASLRKNGQHAEADKIEARVGKSLKAD